MNKVDFLRGTELFKALSDEELAYMVSVLKVAAYEPEEFIFLEGDEADAAYIVLAGEVQLCKTIALDLEKTVFVAGPGDVFGEMGMLENAPRSATAQAIDDVGVLWFGSKLFETIIGVHPAVGAKIVSELARQLSSRLRHTTNLYSAAVMWGMEISGASLVHFHDAIEDCRTLTFELRGGRRLDGRLVRVDADTKDLTILGADGLLRMLPYHAIDLIQLGRLPEIEEEGMRSGAFRYEPPEDLEAAPLDAGITIDADEVG